jgi:hypothetical protein
MNQPTPHQSLMPSSQFSLCFNFYVKKSSFRSLNHIPCSQGLHHQEFPVSPLVLQQYLLSPTITKQAQHLAKDEPSIIQNKLKVMKKGLQL